MNQTLDAQAALSVRFGEGGNACVIFRASRGEGPRSGSIPTLVGALLAGSLARMGRTAASDKLLASVERAANLFASMSQPNILPPDMKLVDPADIGDAHTVCTIFIPTEGQDFVRAVFAQDDPDVAYKSFLYGLQYAIDSLAPETLVAMSSVLKGVVGHFRSSKQWPDPTTVEQELAAGKAGLTRS